jgi:pyridoxal phosphate enzyme (YggS family)
MDIRARHAEVLERIGAAARRSGRDPAAITLIAVAKTFPPAIVREAYEAGLRDFGENKAQELVAKHRELADAAIRWHFVGHLQTNKVRSVVPLAHLIHSIDSLPLAQKIAEAAPSGGTVPALLQVNTSGEPTKYGVAPSDLPALIEGVSALEGITIRGLMTLGPLTEDRSAVRAAFRQLRALSEPLRARVPAASILSMGMSGDFEIAIEEGATHVRVGTALFGARA